MIIYNKQDTYRQFSTTPTAYKKNNVLFLVVYKRRYIKVHHVVHVSFYRSTTTCMLCQCSRPFRFFVFNSPTFFFLFLSLSLSLFLFLSFFLFSHFHCPFRAPTASAHLDNAFHCALIPPPTAEFTTSTPFP